MANDYYSSPADAAAVTLAKSSQLNTVDNAVDQAFNKLPTLADLKGGKINYAADTGALNAYVVTLGYPPASYTDGMLICFKPATTNTGAATINVNALGAKSIVAPDGTVLVAGALTMNGMFDLRYNSVLGKFVLMNPATMYQASSTYATISGVETLTNKTLTSPTIDGGTLNGTNLVGITLTNPTFNTQAPLDNSTKGATTAYADAADTVVLNTVSSTYAPKASPVFTGTPTAPTPTQADNSTKLATTAYVDTLGATKAPLASPTFSGTVSDAAGALRDVPENVQNANYTAVIGDRGKHIKKTDSVAHTYTIPPNSSVAYPIGTVLTFVNLGGTTNNVTVARGAAVALYRAGVNADVTVTPGDMVTALKVATDTWQM